MLENPNATSAPENTSLTHWLPDSLCAGPCAAGIHDPRGSRRLWNLWDMLDLHAADFMKLVINHRTLLMRFRGQTGELPDSFRRSTDKYATQMRAFCDGLCLTTTSDLTKWIEHAKTLRDLMSAMDSVERALHSELGQRKYFAPDPKYASYFDNPKLFGPVVFVAFSSANNDITEAGNCLALERSTACVMHLMRIVETGLAALAKSVGVPHQNDWGSYLREIDKALTAHVKAGRARSSQEQFYAEVALTIDHMRRAWRNPIFHVEKVYAPEQAREILESVKSFMIHLAKEVSE